MSKPKRRSLADLLGQEDTVQDDIITSSRDHVIDDAPAEPAAKGAKKAPANAAKSTSKTSRPKVATTTDEPKELRRNSYHASLYLPEEAQFALREIALTMRRAKPHDVMLEAMAEMFEKYNKGKLARECRSRITTKS